MEYVLEPKMGVTNPSESTITVNTSRVNLAASQHGPSGWVCGKHGDVSFLRAGMGSHTKAQSQKMGKRTTQQMFM